MSVVAFPRRRVDRPTAPPPLSARQVVAFPGRRFPVIEVAPDGGPTPRVIAPRRITADGERRRGERFGTVILSALLHLGVVGLALGATTGALSSGDGGVLQVTLVAALPPSPAASGPAVPMLTQAQHPVPREDQAVAPPRADTAVTQAAMARPVAAPAADAPARPVPPLTVPGLVTAVGQVAAPTDAEGTLPPLPGDAAAPPQTDATALPPPRLPEAAPIAEPAPAPPKPPASHPRPAVAQAGGKARGAGGGAAAGAGGQAAMTATGPAETAAMAGWGARIMAGVERHKHYPLAAGDARGTVGVALSLGRDGQLRAASVAQSSGVAALDLAAVAAVQAAAPFPAAPAALTAGAYSFTLRVKFGG
ncbi:MAG: TonB family protein [Rhodobacteraceae bacterium]|nr:TonB family protein [Paracoccaceae bacterium]